MIEQIVYGVVTGLGYSILGWQANQTKENATAGFEWRKLLKSVIVCSAVGGLAGYTGQDFNMLIVGSVGVGATKTLDLIWKFIKGRFIK